jgi:RimJ/RimL family protein N-acetyltransferase
MSEVETARLLLRRWQDDDLERLVALYGDHRVARFLSVDGRPWPPERSVGAFEHFRRQWPEHDFGPWAAIDKHSDRWLGQIGLNELPRWPGPDKIEVGWDLQPSVWGQGLATEGARAALGYGFEVVGLERIISTARADNAASRRVMEMCGLVFQEEFPTRASWLPGMPSTGPTGRPAKEQPATRSSKGSTDDQRGSTLTARIGAAYVGGLQVGGVAASVKHME